MIFNVNTLTEERWRDMLMKPSSRSYSGRKILLRNNENVSKIAVKEVLLINI